jgi:exodeoxyribonuclease-3
MKIITYNLNGIRASSKLGFLDWLKTVEADVVCLQEIRASEEICKELLKDFNNYHIFYNCGNRKGYAGTITMTKEKPIKTEIGLVNNIDEEGRFITTTFKNFILLNVYVPNGGSRLEYKLQYMKDLKQKLVELSKSNNIILCSDTNTAHNEIDTNKPKQVCHSSSFLPIEREHLSAILNEGFIDVFRFLNPNAQTFTWRSYKSRIVCGDYGWKFRFDYVIVSDSLKSKLINCEIHDLKYCDHLPVILNMENM